MKSTFRSPFVSACASSFAALSFGRLARAERSSFPWRSNEVPLERAQAWLRDADLLLVRDGGPIPWIGRGLHGHVATLARWGGDWFVLETRPGGGRAVPLDAFLRRVRRRVDVFRPNPDGRWPEYRPEKCVAFLRRAVSRRYGWNGVFAAAIARLPFVRLLRAVDYFNDGDAAPPNAPTPSVPPFFARFVAASPSAERCEKAPFPIATANFSPTCEREQLDEIWRFDRELQRRAALHCAEARALADRYAGVDPVPFLNDRFVEPADLARSPFYRYQLTLAPTSTF